MEDVNMDASNNSAKAKTSVLDLNEDCLTEISQYLDFEDLTMFFKTHDHFHNSIERVVAKKTFTLEISDYDYDCKEMKAITKFLFLFGKRLQGLKIKLPAHYDYHDNKMSSIIERNIETLIETCCANGNIKYFSIANFYLSNEFIRENGIFFESLRSLEIESTHDCFKGIFRQLQNITKLKMEIEESGDINKYLKEINLHQLETLQLPGFDSRIKFEKLPISLSIKRLEIPNCGCDPNLLVKHFPCLEYLEFGTNNTQSLEPLLDLPKLKHFSLIFCEEAGEYVVAFLNAIGKRNELETLKLQKLLRNNCPFSRIHRCSNKDYLKNEMVIFNQLHKMTNLRELALDVGPACKNHLKEIALSLKRLQRFTLNCTFGAADYFQELMPKILKFVNLADKLEHLTLTTSLHEDKVNISKFYEELEKIRCSQRSQKVLYICLILVEEPSFRIRNGNLNFHGKYVKSSCRILPSPDCDYVDRCGPCGDYNDSDYY